MTLLFLIVHIIHCSLNIDNFFLLFLLLLLSQTNYVDNSSFLFLFIFQIKIKIMKGKKEKEEEKWDMLNIEIFFQENKEIK